MKRILLLAIALFAGCIMAKAQYAQSSSVVDGPIKYKFGNLYDASGHVIKGQENVISYIGSDNYFNIYQKAHKRYKTGAIVSAVGIGLFAAGCSVYQKDPTAALGFHIWAYPAMITGGIMFFRNNGKMKQLAKKYNYNYNQNSSSLSFGPTSSGVGFAYSF